MVFVQRLISKNGFFDKDKSVFNILKNINYVITLDTNNNYCTLVTKLDVTMIILIGDTIDFRSQW